MLMLAAAVLLPGLFWEHGPESAGALRQAGVDCVHVPAAQAAAWQKTGFCHHPSDRAEREKVPPPGVRWEIDVATATRAPWVDANGWRYERWRQGRFFCEVPRGAAALAAAEAFAYQADVLLRIDRPDLEAYGRTLTFLKRLEGPPLPPRANIAVVDDGSELAGEVLNLLARRNLLFRVVAAPDPQADLSVKAEQDDPSAQADQIRRRLTDEKRLLRLFGSDVVLARLTGDAARSRIHLLNYGPERVEGLRLRVLGSCAKGKLSALGYENAALEDYTAGARSTEFSIPEMERLRGGRFAPVR
ncbi:MAG: hypothetical protein HY238_16400 [Acidobacteria bacterium]|nr:hypothetical protein [Acidobacteriota bacterium]